MSSRVRDELNKLPLWRASRAEWEKRGYKVRRGEYNVQYIKVWNGMHYNRIKIYDIKQCDPIWGTKAVARRDKWYDSVGISNDYFAGEREEK